MSLAIDWDVADQWVASPGFVLNKNNMSGGTTQSAWILPGDLGLMLMPLQLSASWASTTGKWQLTDWYLNPVQWEQVSHRAAGDWFLQSRGLPDGTRLVAKNESPRNAGFFLEFFAFSLAHVVVRDLMILDIGGGLRLHIHSDGTADVEDARPGALQPNVVTGADLTAGGSNLAGKFVQIAVTPWQRGHVLVTSNLGGWFDAAIGDVTDPNPALKLQWSPGQTSYHVTVEAAAVAVTPSPLCRSFFQLSQLRYPASGSWQSRFIAMAHSVAAGPDVLNVQAEQQDGSRASIVLLNSAGAAFAPTPLAPLQTVQVRVDLTSTDTAVSPFVGSITAAYVTVATSRGLAPIRIASPISAELRISRDHGSNSCSLTLDNSAGAWTFLKDLYNRRIRVSWVNDGTVDFASGVLFEGYTDPCEFADGVGSTITLHSVGLRKRLRTHILPAGMIFDGMLHTDCVRWILYDSGIADLEMEIAPDDGVRLSAAVPGQFPLYQVGEGVTADQFIVHLCDVVSGWSFNDVAGAYVYAPRFNISGIDPLTLPQFVQQTAAVFTPNDVIMTELREIEEEPRANDLTVIGQDDFGNALTAHYVDWAGISDPTYANYLGARREFMFKSGALSSLGDVSAALGVIAARMTQRRRRLRVKTLGYSPNPFAAIGPVNVVGYGPALIVNCVVDLSCDRDRRAELELELF